MQSRMTGDVDSTRKVSCWSVGVAEEQYSRATQLQGATLRRQKSFVCEVHPYQLMTQMLNAIPHVIFSCVSRHFIHLPSSSCMKLRRRHKDICGCRFFQQNYNENIREEEVAGEGSVFHQTTNSRQR